jgi:menaquinone-9 beta-reductase
MSVATHRKEADMTTGTLQMIAEASHSIWDVIIIGAGPAGCSLALSLAKKNRRVLLVERATFPRPKVCGGCMSHNTIAAFEQLGLLDLLKNCGLQTVNNMILANNSTTVKLPIENWSLSRYSLDESLFRACRSAGVECLSQTRATMLDDRSDTRTVQLQMPSGRAQLQARVVVLASGLSAGVVKSQSRIGAGVILDSTPADYPANTLGMAVGTGGYVGWVQVENQRFDLAAAFDAAFVKAQGSLGNAATAVIAEAGFPRIPNLTEAAWKGTPFLSRKPTRLAGPRWFAVGDAAGYVEPFTGEGMAWAMHGALALAPIVDRAIAGWKPDSCAERSAKSFARRG